jgi:hypothetical protein
MLTSLGEMTVHDVTTHSSTVVHVDCEPSFCSLGPSHLAVGLNNQVLFYTHCSTPGQLVNRRSYLGGVHAVCLNDTYAAVLTDGRVLVHALEAGASGGAPAEQDMCLPQPGAVRSEPITLMALSHHFLVTATSSSTLCYHTVQDGVLAAVNEFKHTGGSVWLGEKERKGGYTGRAYSDGVDVRWPGLSRAQGQLFTMCCGLLRRAYVCVQVAKSLSCTLSPMAQSWCWLTTR